MQCVSRGTDVIRVCQCQGAVLALSIVCAHWIWMPEFRNSVSQQIIALWLTAGWAMLLISTVCCFDGVVNQCIAKFYMYFIWLYMYETLPLPKKIIITMVLSSDFQSDMDWQLGRSGILPVGCFISFLVFKDVFHYVCQPYQ